MNCVVSEFDYQFSSNGEYRLVNAHEETSQLNAVQHCHRSINCAGVEFYSRWNELRLRQIRVLRLVSAALMTISCLVLFMGASFAEGPVAANINDTFDSKIAMVLHELDEKKVMAALDLIISDATEAGVVYPPAHFLRALRNQENSNDNPRQYQADVIVSVDAGIQPSIFLLPFVSEVEGLDGLGKFQYLERSLTLLKELAPHESWIVPFTMKLLLRQVHKKGEVANYSGLYTMYNSSALAGGSPLSNSLLLSEGVKSADSQKVVCSRILLSGDVDKMPTCRGVATADSNSGIVSDVEKARYREIVEKSLGLRTREIKEIKDQVCGFAAREKDIELICLDILSAASVLCVFRTKSVSFPRLERRFVCSAKDLAWIRNATLDVLNEGFGWKIR
jgi:hypothetical protein